MARILAAQGAYYLLTGAWSLVHIRSFTWVTGPKTDVWLVKTVGVLVCAIGAALVQAARQPQPSPEARLLATGSAVGLTAIEAWYAARRRISPIYLLDAAAELATVVALVRAPESASRVPSQPHAGTTAPR